jgi:hypothetical protein
MKFNNCDSIKNILLFILIFVIFYLVYKSKFTKSDKSLCVKENFSPDSSVQNQVDIIFDKIYNIDVESMKNMGAICKTLLTGSGYYISPDRLVGSNELTLPSVIVENQLIINGDLNISNTLIVNNGCVEVDVLSDNNSILFPEGMILPFGSTTPPKGWLLCDGNNGTPDLRGRYILGDIGLGVDMSSINTDINNPHSYDAPPTWGSSIYDGENTTILNQFEVPKHTHNMIDPNSWTSNGTLYQGNKQSYSIPRGVGYHDFQVIPAIENYLINNTQSIGINSDLTREYVSKLPTNPNSQAARMEVRYYNDISSLNQNRFKDDNKSWVGNYGFVLLREIIGVTPHNNIPPSCALNYIIRLNI